MRAYCKHYILYNNLTYIYIIYVYVKQEIKRIDHSCMREKKYRVKLQHTVQVTSRY